jgi:hypothetical protein
MESITITGIVLITLATKGLTAFAIVYAGARLAIRHERRVSH